MLKCIRRAMTLQDIIGLIDNEMHTIPDTVIHRWLRVPYTLNVRIYKKVKQPEATLLFIHGIGDNGNMWRKVVDQLPSHLSVVVVDLLGFGDSPKPHWGTYDAKMQARSLLSTYLKLRITSKVVVVGHSLGALVAIEFAKKFPLLTQSLILCSPPIYDHDVRRRLSIRPDKLLRDIYGLAADDPQRLIRLYVVAKKVGLGNESLSVNSENVTTFIATLRASIINQSTIRDITKLTLPITILHGLLDPFVIRRNLVSLAKKHQNIIYHEVAAAHIIRGLYAKKIVAVISSTIKRSS